MSAPHLLNPSDPRFPKFWMYEQSGVLRPAIKAYLNGETLEQATVAVIRAYLRQWIMSPVWDDVPAAYVVRDPYCAERLRGLREGINSLTNRAQINTWLREALDIGIDPL